MTRPIARDAVRALSEWHGVGDLDAADAEWLAADVVATQITRGNTDALRLAHLMRDAGHPLPLINLPAAPEIPPLRAAGNPAPSPFLFGTQA